MIHGADGARGWLARAWEAPNDALGRLAAGIVAGAPRRSIDGVTVVEDPRFGRLFRLVPNRPSAMTFGSTVVARRRLDASLAAHELTHVAQYRRFGPFFAAVYLLGAAWGAVRHRQSYFGNPLEVAAMRAGKRAGKGAGKGAGKRAGERAGEQPRAGRHHR